MKSQTPNSLCFFVLLEFQYIKTGRGIFVFFHVMEHIPGLGNVPKLKLRQINFLSYGHRGGEIPGGLPLKKYRVTRQKFSIRDTKILFCANLFPPPPSQGTGPGSRGVQILLRKR